LTSFSRSQRHEELRRFEGLLIIWALAELPALATRGMTVAAILEWTNRFED
jgi:hypothetical protein